jgi:hypothetical protein
MHNTVLSKKYLQSVLMRVRLPLDEDGALRAGPVVIRSAPTVQSRRVVAA